MPVRVAVFIDWQNAYGAARRAFGLTAEAGRRGIFSPLRVSEKLARFNRRGDDGRLVYVEIHRGLPNPEANPIGHGAATRHADAWVAESPSLVVPKLRPLKFNAQKGADEEKGVDVAIACSVLEYVVMGKCDVAVIFSHDSDLLPPIESLCRLRGPGVIETASWASDSYKYRIPPPRKPAGGRFNVVNHALSEEIFEEVETPVNYAKHLVRRETRPRFGRRRR